MLSVQNAEPNTAPITEPYSNVREWQRTMGIVEAPAIPRERREAPRPELDQATPHMESLPRPIKSLREVEGAALFSIKQRYFGYVAAVHDDYIQVQLTDARTGEYADAEIPKEMVKPDDQEFLHEGLEFVWIFGYEATASLKQSAILYIPKFRRVTEEALSVERARVDAVMDRIFGPLNPHTGSTARP